MTDAVTALPPGRPRPVTPPTPADPLPAEPELSPLAAFLLANPEAAATVIAEHVPDRHGRCVRCGIGDSRGREVWPCTVRSAAGAAMRVVPAPERPVLRIVEYRRGPAPELPVGTGVPLQPRAGRNPT